MILASVSMKRKGNCITLAKFITWGLAGKKEDWQKMRNPNQLGKEHALGEFLHQTEDSICFHFLLR